MSGRGRSRGNRSRHGYMPTLASVARATGVTFAPDSPVLAMFRAAAYHLNDRQDRHERLIKLSRDLTIESKRIIFLLHSAVRKEDNYKVIRDAGDRLENVIDGPIKAIAFELMYCLPYLHSRAVSPGFQEFVEAYTLWYYMKERRLVQWSQIQDRLQYNYTEKVETGEEVDKVVTAMLTPNDYMLGLADLTGELMRRVINSISSGDTEECFHTCQFVRNLYTGYLGLSGINKELIRKISTTRSNVAKVEAAVYALRVRGREAPPKLLLPALPPASNWEERQDDDDEGCYPKQ